MSPIRYKGWPRLTERKRRIAGPSLSKSARSIPAGMQRWCSAHPEHGDDAVRRPRSWANMPELPLANHMLVAALRSSSSNVTRPPPDCDGKISFEWRWASEHSLQMVFNFSC